MKRREFLAFLAASANAATKLTYRQRVDRAVAGQDVDRPPFTFWYHFLLEKFPPERHAEATLSFHRRLRTDLVKVMSDFPYPKPAGNWYQLKIDANPFPSQIRALELIRDGLKGGAYFVETIFNPWNVAEKLSSAEEVQRLKAERATGSTGCPRGDREVGGQPRQEGHPDRRVGHLSGYRECAAWDSVAR